MARQQPSKTSRSRREKEHAKMLEVALARPGVREVMQVYGGWLEIDRRLDPYRSATKQPERITTTNSSNAC